MSTTDPVSLLLAAGFFTYCLWWLLVWIKYTIENFGWASEQKRLARIMAQANPPQPEPIYIESESYWDSALLGLSPGVRAEFLSLYPDHEPPRLVYKNNTLVRIERRQALS